MTLYRSLIIDLYKNPINKRKMRDPDITASGANIACGDRVRIYAKFAPVKAKHSRGQQTGGRTSSGREKIDVAPFGRVNKVASPRRLGLAEVSFEGEGCAISIAAASLLTQKAKDATPAQILKWGAKDVFEWLGQELGPNRAKCGLLALETLQKGIISASRQQDGTFRAQWQKA